MSLPIVNLAGQPYPVSKIVCVGLNYRSHAKEMNSPEPAQPVVFMKPSTALSQQNTLTLPTGVGQVHHEIELVALIGRTCTQVSTPEAEQAIAGYGLGLDLTLRDLQAQAKQKGQPWTLAKGFDQSAPVSDFIPGPIPKRCPFHLTINGTLRQQGCPSDLIFSIPEVIAYVSRFMTLLPGDLLFSGTPSGVGPLHSGDHIQAYIGERPMLDLRVL